MRQSARLSNKDFIFNMINSTIGVGLLAKPYALYIAGWYSIISVSMAFVLVVYASFAMAEVTMDACKIHIKHGVSYDGIPDRIDSEESQSDDDPSNEAVDAPNTNNKSVYQIIGRASLGKYGEYYPNIALFVGVAILSINIIIIEWQLITGTITYFAPNATITSFYLNERMIFVYIFASLFPTVLISKWKELTLVGIISTLSIAILIVTLGIVFISARYRFPDGHVPSYYFHDSSFDIKNAAQYAIDQLSLPQRVLFAFLTFKNGMDGSCAIPQLVIALKNKTRSNIFGVILVSYALTVVISVTFGIISVVIYRGNVSVMLLNNLFIWPSGTSVYVMVAVIIKIVNLWASYQFWVCIGTDVLCSKTQTEDAQAMHVRMYIVRIVLLSLFVIVAYFTRYHLAFMTALLGAVEVGLGCTLTLPLVLYIGMFYHKISIISKIFHILLIILAVTCSVFVVYGTINGLLF
eukprot:231727_1